MRVSCTAATDMSETHARIKNSRSVRCFAVIYPDIPFAKDKTYKKRLKRTCVFSLSGKRTGNMTVRILLSEILTSTPFAKDKTYKKRLKRTCVFCPEGNMTVSV